MNKLVIAAILVLSFATTAQAARKKAKQPIDGTNTSESCSPAYGGCSDDTAGDDDQSSDATYTDRSGTYEGNDRDTGSDYIDGMPY